MGNDVDIVRLQRSRILAPVGNLQPETAITVVWAQLVRLAGTMYTDSLTAIAYIYMGRPIYASSVSFSFFHLFLFLFTFSIFGITFFMVIYSLHFYINISIFYTIFIFYFPYFLLIHGYVIMNSLTFYFSRCSFF